MNGNHTRKRLSKKIKRFHDSGGKTGRLIAARRSSRHVRERKEDLYLKKTPEHRNFPRRVLLTSYGAAQLQKNCKKRICTKKGHTTYDWSLTWSSAPTQKINSFSLHFIRRKKKNGHLIRHSYRCNVTYAEHKPCIGQTTVPSTVLEKKSAPKVDLPSARFYTLSSRT